MYILPTYIDKNTIIKNNNKTRNECLHRLILNKKDLVIPSIFYEYSNNLLLCINIIHNLLPNEKRVFINNIKS